MEKIFFFFIFTFSVFSPCLFAQWSNNPAVNTTVCDTTGEQVTPKIALTSDNGCYISWFDSRSGNYDVYLQKLNSNGEKQFAPGGLLISSNPQNSSLVDYDLAVDAGNNALITFTDIRNGSSINPFAYKISPAGTFLWGANGITLTDSSAIFQANPKVVCTTDENYVFAWIYASTPRKIAMQKLNSAGVPQWGSAPVKLSGGAGENYDWPAMINSDSGSVILLWSGYTGTFINPGNYKLYTQKFSANNIRLWSVPQDTVYSLGNVSGFYTPRLFSDGNNGAIYCWRDDRDLNNNRSAFVHRFSSSGVKIFPVNGAECSINSTMNHFDPIAVSVPSTGETFAFWSEANSGQTLAGGLFGQKFSSTGTRLWNDNGVQFKPMDNNTFSGLSVLSRDTSVFVNWDETIYSSINCLIRAFKTGPSGILQWSGSIVNAGTSLSEKISPNTVLTDSAMLIVTWYDRRNDGGGIYAQNIKSNGTLGPLTGISKENNTIPLNYKLFQNYPNPFNPETVIRYSINENAYVSIKVFDILGREISQLVNGFQKTGIYEIKFSLNSTNNNLSAGVYYYKMTANNYSETKTMIILK